MVSFVHDNETPWSFCGCHSILCLLSQGDNSCALSAFLLYIPQTAASPTANRKPTECLGLDLKTPNLNNQMFHLAFPSKKTVFSVFLFDQERICLFTVYFNDYTNCDPLEQPIIYKSGRVVWSLAPPLNLTVHTQTVWDLSQSLVQNKLTKTAPLW